MPSFLSKVFTRKKDEKDASHPPKRTSVASLLEGKFEAVSPPASPSATNVVHAQQAPKEEKKEEKKEKEKDVGFSLFRTRSPRPTSPKTDTAKPQLPHLTLNLPEEKSSDGRQLASVFDADAGERAVLPNDVIGERRLNPSEALNLVKACSTAIVDRGGLETLGVMHPHWYSASPDVQRRLISLFILSLASKSPSTLPPSPNSPSALFNTELEYTRSPHDLAAVLRWALRHLRLEGDFFGLGSSSAEPWQWYKTFSEAERAASYPSSAFSRFLTPQLPPAHLRLLEATLEIVSSLASHSDRSGVSGSKLSKLFGLWLLTTRRAEDGDDWSTFYARWERAGRILEHLLLAQTRDEMARTKMPRRLVELVAGYPYLKTGEPADYLLPRPRLSTRTYDALYVRVETRLPDFSVSKPKQPPQQIIADAVKAEGAAQAGEHDSLWELLKQHAAATEKTALAPEDDTGPALSRVFTDETIRLFSMLPSEGSKTEATTVKLGIPEHRGRSRSVGAGQNGTLTNGTTRATMSTTDLSPKDWSDFSSLGFGDTSLGKDLASTLMDNDLEVTEPPLVHRKSSKTQRASPPRRTQLDATSRTVTLPSKCASVNFVQIDEAFIDFWSDALFDPIASNWPSFVICQLRPVAGLEANGKPLSWLVIEQVFTRPPPPPEPASPVLYRAASPKPSLRSNISARKSVTFSNAKKRFTLFSSKDTIGSLDAKLATRKKTGKPSTVGEMGEILSEEPENPPAAPEKTEAEAKSPGSTGAEVAAGVAAAAAAAAATAGTAAAASEKVDADLPPVPIVESEAPVVEAVTAVTPVKSDEEPTEKPTKFVEHITPPTNTSPASSEVNGGDQDVAESKELPPAPEPVVLAGETPGPDVALSTSEPVAMAEASAHAESASAEEPGAPAVVEETRPAPQEVEVATAATEPVDVVPAESEAALVQESLAVPDVEAEAPAGLTEVAAEPEAVEPPAPVAEPEVLPTEEEPAAEPTLAAEDTVVEPTAAEVAVAEDEPQGAQEPVQSTEEPTAQGTSGEPDSAVAAPEEKEPVAEEGAPIATKESALAAPEEPEEPSPAALEENIVAQDQEEPVVEEPVPSPPAAESTEAVEHTGETAEQNVEGAPESSKEPVVEPGTQVAEEPRNGSAHADDTA
ncbi:uncharacterized protein C8Q71DRAFT_567206 [Rhodofomes roseus]|uniref:Meiotically up-regulated protein Msb1/Mug8 domain-containing protein n=1 Tax=Rhodofomes roseus TaxID=34475 RepID=A0ABQ8KIU2_9APHY|nr:uncharacterized protein C8Q71DRAFT_567206 [Rhodofomes roseus]KAH9837891.1 hypothetical protein C8Q71DRAFT_567206 [Rhodofomes roseus]